jgi:hypothetical protein
MKMTRDIVTDLLPAYFSGEASTDTRRLVETYFREDPEFERHARGESSAWRTLAPPRPLTSEAALETILRTKRLIRLRGTWMGCAIFLSLLPLAFTFDSSATYWAWQAFPLGAVIAAGLAGCAWFGYFRIRRMLQATGA